MKLLAARGHCTRAAARRSAAFHAWRVARSAMGQWGNGAMGQWGKDETRKDIA